jgi:VanZ family protein
MSSNGAVVREMPPRLRFAPPQRKRGRKGAGFWISAWLPVAIGIGVIVLESTPWFGADHTSRPLRTIFQAIFGQVSDARWNVIHHYIRKTGHFTGYGLIGLAWLRAWWMTLPRSRFFSDALLALIGTGLLATWDEWHQSFLPNRTSSPWDVLLDCSGAISLCLVAYVFVRLFRPARLVRT